MDMYIHVAVIINQMAVVVKKRVGQKEKAKFQN